MVIEWTDQEGETHRGRVVGRRAISLEDLTTGSRREVLRMVDDGAYVAPLRPEDVPGDLIVTRTERGYAILDGFSRTTSLVAGGTQRWDVCVVAVD